MAVVGLFITEISCDLDTVDDDVSGPELVSDLDLEELSKNANS